MSPWQSIIWNNLKTRFHVKKMPGLHMMNFQKKMSLKHLFLFGQNPKLHHLLLKSMYHFLNK